MLSVKVDKEKETETVEEKKTEIKTKKISHQTTRSRKNVPGTLSLKSVRKELVEDENKEHIPPDDTKIPEREIKITSC